LHICKGTASYLINVFKLYFIFQIYIELFLKSNSFFLFETFSFQCRCNGWHWNKVL
jgi:hypothetical protein